MALKNLYSTLEASQLLDMAVKNLLKRATREGWKFQKRVGRGGGKEWLVSSMPEATQRAIQTAEERRAIEEEAAHNAALPAPYVKESDVPVPMKRAIMDDKRRYKALAKADLLGLYMDWQAKFGSTVKQKQAFILAYQSGTWSKVLMELGPRISWKTLEKWKLTLRRNGSVLMLVDRRGVELRGRRHAYGEAPRHHRGAGAASQRATDSAVHGSHCGALSGGRAGRSFGRHGAALCQTVRANLLRPVDTFQGRKEGMERQMLPFHPAGTGSLWKSGKW